MEASRACPSPCSSWGQRQDPREELVQSHACFMGGILKVILFKYL